MVQSKYREPFIVADIPGLIEGAHEGVGLGHKFLRHIERTRILLHVIDASGLEGEPFQQYQVIENELSQFNEELIGRERLVLLNKTDIISPEDFSKVADSFTKAGVSYIAISAETGAGLDELKEWLVEILFEGD